MQYINQKFYVPHELIIREILHPWNYKEKLLHNCLRMQYGLNRNLRRVGSQEIKKYR